ncbi:MAG: Mg/Co/Ni transporter MgtE / CBS domain [Candidatus Ozemobacter sibiricus]|jgi:CBS domain-containing protein/sporulation protein YlmC with PRC-barrel domain|uniref:Mg/Co/Ni transporter MgtE / CBS domain n=1 Tax=Candidatus Ozemobacter sibiricus TaxID=2268124 RepID=A0A367ZLY5_9BACT|nr:MAG: Mg/Co/Ni transporter MgtE / CBS domain [Candidatus Ozemobacter sibiricus]
MQSAEKKYFLADLVGAPVIDPAGAVIGRVVDFTFLVGGKYPKINQAVLQLAGEADQRLVPRERFQTFGPATFALSSSPTDLPWLSSAPDQYLARSIWDKQIIDTSDVRVVRVNDLQIAEVRGEWFLIAVDVGLQGLLRRLGFDRWVCPLMERLHWPVRHEVIAWDLIQSFPTGMSPLKLAVPSNKVQDMHPADLADILEDLSVHEGVSLIQTLDDETAAETLAEADPETQVQIIASLPSHEASDILEEMEPDEAVDILQDLDDQKAAEILSHMEPSEASDVRELLKHAENTAGGLMSTGYATIYEEFTVADAFKHLRLVAIDLEIIYYLYVVDHQDRLKGVVSIRNLLVADPAAPVTSIMNRDLIFVAPEAPQEEVATLIARYNLLALPVLGLAGDLLGVVTVDDVMDLLLENMPRMWKRRALTS